MSITCCYQCEKRHPHCHATCEEYKKARDEHLEEQAEIYRKKAVKYGLYEQRRRGVIKALKIQQDRRSRKRGK